MLLLWACQVGLGGNNVAGPAHHLDALLTPLSHPPAKPFDPTFLLSCTISNVICCLVFGERFDYEDKHFLRLLYIISEVLKFGSSPRGQVGAGPRVRVIHWQLPMVIPSLVVFPPTDVQPLSSANGTSAWTPSQPVSGGRGDERVH